MTRISGYRFPAERDAFITAAYSLADVITVVDHPFFKKHREPADERRRPLEALGHLYKPFERVGFNAHAQSPGSVRKLDGFPIALNGDVDRQDIAAPLVAVHHDILLAEPPDLVDQGEGRKLP